MVVRSSGWLCGVVDCCVEKFVVLNSGWLYRVVDDVKKWMVVSSTGWLCRVVDGLWNKWSCSVGRCVVVDACVE